MSVNEDWQEYRQLFIQSLKRIEEGLSLTKSDVHDMRVDIALLRKAVDSHDKFEERVKVLEIFQARIVWLITGIAALMMGAWTLVLGKIIN